jgi:hypothetical protein
VWEHCNVLAEMIRVIRTGGRVAITDADWATLSIGLPEDELQS